MLTNLFNVLKNTEYTLYFFPTPKDTTTSWAGKTGLTSDFAGGSLKISKDGGAPATLSNTVSEVGFGWYKIVLTASEMNADNILITMETAIVTSNAYLNAQYISTSTSSGGGSAITVDDLLETSIPNKVTLPRGDLTIRQIFELLLQRLGRNNPKI